MHSDSILSKHHIQKIIGIFAAMRTFANTLQSNGHKVIYLKLDDDSNRQSLAENINHLIAEHEFQRFEYLLPDEYRVDKHPKEVIDAAVNAWKNGSADLAQTEGFVRQILGWREYMRGIYWAKMPEYEKLNFFEHNKPLPEFFWTGKTKMNCVQHTVSQSLKHAYAHHIQRLMVTGNFALLAGIYPDALDDWYLGIYIDAFQWVEMTNTRGMSQYADGGLLASKPYVSSANYIDKMSNYCKNCYYNKKEKTEEKACPLNALYWDFIDRNRDKLSGNQRMSMMYRLWDKNSPQQKEAVLVKASEIKKNVEDL